MKHKSLLIRFFVCISFTFFLLYFYIDKQNQTTEIRKLIPKIKEELHKVNEENRLLNYEIKCLETPQYLLKSLNSPEFTHLHPSSLDEIKILTSKKDAEP